MKTLVIDIDGTICSQENPENYKDAIPKVDVIDSINKYYENGYIIIFYTARHITRRELTENWMNENGVKYHYISYGKPVGDFYIDDKNRSINDMLEGELY